MLILLTNDDGVYAPGLTAMESEFRRLGDVVVVAPATEQSGVGHAITYLTPLTVKEVFRNDDGSGDRRWGWAVQGSPADCVKIGIHQFCPRPPDLVLSGINSGLNAGINVLYSGTVAAAIEGAFFGITSVAVSLEFDEHARFDKAARLAREIVEQILEKKGPEPQLYNLNIPTAALSGAPEVCVVPMNVTRYGDRFEKRIDPWGRDYYLARPAARADTAPARNRPVGPGQGKSDHHAAGLQHDSAGRVGGDGAMAVSAVGAGHRTPGRAVRPKRPHRRREHNPGNYRRRWAIR